MDCIRVIGLELRCIVGVRSFERRREQPLTIDIELGVDLATAGRSGLIGETVDYANVADTMTSLLRFREYRLLEVAAEEATAMLFATYPLIGQVKLRLDKPEALAGRARCASVEITRARGAFGWAEEATDFGSRIEVLRTSEGLVEQLRVDPGKSVTLRDEHDRLETVVRGTGQGRFSVARQGACTSYEAGSEALLLGRCVGFARRGDAALAPRPASGQTAKDRTAGKVRALRSGKPCG